MAQVIKEIKVEVSKPNFFEAIVAKQFDNKSRWLRVQLMDNGEKIVVDDTSTVTINARRTDGGEKSFEGSVDKGEGTVLVPLAYWMLQLEGKVVSDISVTDTSGRILTSTSFIIQVERASCQDNNISDDDVNVVTLRSLIEEVQQVKGSYEVEQTYDSTNTKALSGVAVAQALESLKEYVDELFASIENNGGSTNPEGGGTTPDDGGDDGSEGGGTDPEGGGTTPDDGGGTDSGRIYFSNYDPQVGGITTSSGQYNGNLKKRYVNLILIPVKVGDRITIDDDTYNFGYYMFDESETYIDGSSSGEYHTDITVDWNGYVRLSVGFVESTDLTTLTDTEKQKIADSVIITTY